MKNLTGYVTGLVLFSLITAASSYADTILKDGSKILTVNTDGCPQQIEIPDKKIRLSCAGSLGNIVVPGKVFPFGKAISIQQKTNKIRVEYKIQSTPTLKLVVEYSFAQNSDVPVLAREVFIWRADNLKTLPTDLTVRINYSPVPPQIDDVWLPLKNGVGEKNGFLNNEAVYKAAGKFLNTGSDLAIPMFISSSADSARDPIAIYADPYFSTTFSKTDIRWTYAKQVGFEDGVEKRTLYVAFLQKHTDLRGLTNHAIDVFYRTALAEIPKGPEWLHDIALVTYDYMSDKGHGWKNDIDALSSAIPLAKRHKVMVTLHGWFDLVGRFGFTPGRSQMDDSWDNFISPTVGRLTVAHIRERMQYAKDRGFKVGFYYANGMNSASDPRVAIAQNPDHVLRRLKSGWSGPDMAGSQALVLNPSHPSVYKYFVDLAKAEVSAFGDLVDAYVSDETFYVTAGDLGTARVPGYADRAFMRLTKDIAKAIHDKYPHAAFLTSDDIGLFPNVPPYALFADGTYQDANVKPINWSYAIFPNYRNAVFNCNWHTKQKHQEMEFGVRNYQAPVVVTNGWADDYGFSEMTDQERELIMQLFDWRSQFRTDLQWFEALPQFQKK